MNEVRIQIPEGMEIDRDLSTFECIKFKLKELTYDDIAKKLFVGNPIFYIDSHGDIERIYDKTDCLDSNNAVSRKQCQRILAINQLINVAYYFNEIVDKDVYRPTERYTLFIEGNEKVGVFKDTLPFRKTGVVYFKTQKSAKQAIKILGEETIKLAISL